MAIINSTEITMVSTTPPFFSISLNTETIMKAILEIRAAVGGEDARLFTKELGDAYIKMIELNN